MIMFADNYFIEVMLFSCRTVNIHLRRVVYVIILLSDSLKRFVITCRWYSRYKIKK